MKLNMAATLVMGDDMSYLEYGLTECNFKGNMQFLVLFEDLE